MSDGDYQVENKDGCWECGRKLKAIQQRNESIDELLKERTALKDAIRRKNDDIYGMSQEIARLKRDVASYRSSMRAAVEDNYQHFRDSKEVK